MMRTFSIRERSVQLKNEDKKSARGKRKCRLYKKQSWRRRKIINLKSKSTNLFAQKQENLQKVVQQL